MMQRVPESRTSLRQPTAKWTGNITGAGLSDDDDDDDDDDSLLSDEDEDDGSEAAPVTRRKPPVAAVREESDFSLANGNYDLSDDNDPDPDLDIGQADKRPKPQKAAQPAAPAENDGNSEDDF
uniref:Uncharacterized protein n=1 Tax=Plectus sambesii TaxID=2011161 RepID=A0A914WDD6_9BILA